MSDTVGGLIVMLALLESTRMPIGSIKPHLDKATTQELADLFEATSNYAIHQHITESMGARADQNITQRSFLKLLPKTEYFGTQDLLCIAAAKQPARDEMPLILALCKYANSKESYDALRERLKQLTPSTLIGLLTASARWQQELIVTELLTRNNWPKYFLDMFKQKLDESRPKYHLLEAAEKEQRITSAMAYTLMQTRWRSDQSVIELFAKKLQTVPVAQKVKWYRTINNDPGRRAILQSLENHSPKDLERYLKELFIHSLKVNELGTAIGYLGKKSPLSALLVVRQKTKDQDILEKLDRLFNDRADELRSLVGQP